MTTAEDRLQAVAEVLDSRHWMDEPAGNLALLVELALHIDGTHDESDRFAELLQDARERESYDE